MSKHHRTVENWNVQVQLAGAFLQNFGGKIPEDFGHLFMRDECPEFMVVCCDQIEGHTEQCLTLSASIFGVNGWAAKLDSDRLHYNWSREINGVKVTIYHADSLPPLPPEQPVPPSKFPLQIADANPA